MPLSSMSNLKNKTTNGYQCLADSLLSSESLMKEPVTWSSAWHTRVKGDGTTPKRWFGGLREKQWHGSLGKCAIYVHPTVCYMMLDAIYYIHLHVYSIYIYIQTCLISTITIGGKTQWPALGFPVNWGEKVFLGPLSCGYLVCQSKQIAEVFG